MYKGTYMAVPTGYGPRVSPSSSSLPSLLLHGVCRACRCPSRPPSSPLPHLSSISLSPPCRPSFAFHRISNGSRRSRRRRLRRFGLMLPLGTVQLTRAAARQSCPRQSSPRLLVRASQMTVVTARLSLVGTVG